MADLFMWLMLSRPDGLSLRTSWVTPATLALALAIMPLGTAAGIAALLLAALHGSWILFAAALLSLGLAVGAGSVGLFGLRQRVLLAKNAQASTR